MDVQRFLIGVDLNAVWHRVGQWWQGVGNRSGCDAA
jgi:hypothetical protein